MVPQIGTYVRYGTILFRGMCFKFYILKFENLLSHDLIAFLSVR
jgi:hypothetical protein